MASLVLARKWRPQTFAQLIGQEPIVKAMHNALTGDKLAQAYVFSGIRGVGKTTAARLLAKALNCERGPAEEPCNECRSCREIGTSSSLDVIEVDAATYSKVEQVRELTESLRYGPASGQYKVVILDEVHRLSRQAFDALLKVVEEPPAHLVFIFATTERDAVPATILSRCQQYQFRRVPAAELAQHLRGICEAESIQTTDTALRLIARAGEGSVRDSIALLDQLATFGGGTITEKDVSSLLGALDTSTFLQVASAIFAGNGPAISEAIAKIERSGWDPSYVYTQFLSYCRDALHLAMNPNLDQVDLADDDAASLLAFARQAGYENLLRFNLHLLRSEQTVRRSGFGLLALELIWLQAAEIPKLTQVEALITGDAAPLGRRSTAADLAPQPPAKRVVKEQPAAQRKADGRVEGRPAAALQRGNGDQIARFQRQLRNNHPRLGSLLQQAEGLHFTNGTLAIQGDPLLCQSLARKSNAVQLEQVLHEVFGSEARWQCRETKAAPAEAGRRSEQGASTGAGPATDKDDEAIHHPVVQATLDIFKGDVESVHTLKGDDEK